MFLLFLLTNEIQLINMTMLRQALKEDLPAITALFRDTVRHVNSRDYSPEQIAAWSSAADNSDCWEDKLVTQYFVVATDQQGNIQGFGSITPQGYFDTIYVGKDNQRQGIAKAIIESLMHYARTQNVGIVTSEVSITARPFFERFGFEWVHTQQKPFAGSVFTNYMMRRTLVAPLIETERLILRPFIQEDAPDFYALNNDPEVVKYTGDAAFPDVEAARVFLQQYRQYELYGMGRLAVLLKSTGEYLGWSGLKYMPETDEVDIGYRFFRRHWGQGYATESSRASMEFGFKQLGLERLVARSMEENLASIHVIQKLGLRFVKKGVSEDHSWLMYAITRDEWLNNES